MENNVAKAYLRYVRISPRKIQIVCDLIRGKDVGTAMAILMQTPKAASEPLMKLLKSAAANAENNFGMDPAKLVRLRGVRHPRPHPQAHHAPGPGPCLPHQQAHFSRHHRCDGKGIRKEEDSFMGQKVNPHGLRVGVIKDWDSRWYASEEKVGDLIVEDQKIRKYLKKPSSTAPAFPRSRSSAAVGRQRGRHHLPALRPSRCGHRQGRRADRAVSPERREAHRQEGQAEHRRGQEPRYERPAGGREHRPAAREADLSPPRHEERHGPRHARRRQGHQGLLLRPSGRPRDRRR